MPGLVGYSSSAALSSPEAAEGPYFNAGGTARRMNGAIMRRNASSRA